MADMTRRTFIQKAGTSTAAIYLGAATVSHASQDNFMEPVKLGNTNVHMTRIAMGTGSHGWQRSSQQVRLGEKKFLDLAKGT